jgi:hypothetical protein
MLFTASFQALSQLQKVTAQTFFLVFVCSISFFSLSWIRLHLISCKHPNPMAENNDMQRTISSSSHNSVNSITSETPFNVIPEPVHDPEGTTYFLLDVDNETSPPPPLPPPTKSKRHKSKKSLGEDESEDDNSSTDSSSSSSVSAQVVIDHGSSIPRRMEKNGATHLLRSGDDESESDYAFCYTPGRRESDADSATHPQQRRLRPASSHLMMEISGSHSQQDTDLSAAENDGDEEDIEASVTRLSKSNTAHKISDNINVSETNDHKNHNRRRRRHHRHHRNGGSRREILANSKAMVTVYTEEDDDLVDEMPSGDRERMMRHNERNYRRDVSAGYRRRLLPRRLHKRTQRVLQTNLQSHSWSRRESQQSNRHPGLSSEDALRYLPYFYAIYSLTYSL